MIDVQVQSRLSFACDLIDGQTMVYTTRKHGN